MKKDNIERETQLVILVIGY